MNYRPLTDAEKTQLLGQACTADCWDAVQVKDGFDASYVRDVHFSGRIRLGVFQSSFELPGGLMVHSGISHAVLHNTEVGDNCHLCNIHNYIANYRIGDYTCIENVNAILVDGESRFGNGIRVPVMNEGGGREIPIYDHLSASLAYILALYRHRPLLIECVTRMIDDYARQQCSSIGEIGEHVRILNVGSIKNVRIGSYAEIIGTSRLENGSLNSNERAPIRLGSGVKCTDFIIASGSEIKDSTIVDKCFVGQGCIFDKHYSAVESLFFSNCQGMHGESAAIFAGPYTVTHHKSTLLIAGMFSFLNAGSGSNQSNHMYKLGPIHQGVAERGVKTASDSYLLWPSRIGAFSLVMGRHTHHADTSDLPFSYLIENHSETYVVPGANLKTVGTIRDAQKWPKRDRRQDPVLLDAINFNLLSPFTVQKMWNGRDILRRLQLLSGGDAEVYDYHNCKIRNSSLVHGIQLYEMGIMKYLGNVLVSRIEQSDIHDLTSFREALQTTDTMGTGEWVDLAGLIAPKEAVTEMLDEIERGELHLNEIQDTLRKIHDHYALYEWTWVAEKLETIWGCKVNEVNQEMVVDTIRHWQEAVLKLDRLVYEDAKKEFDLNSQTGFGMDGDCHQRQADFAEVRGSFENNDFVKTVVAHMEKKSVLATKIINQLEVI